MHRMEVAVIGGGPAGLMAAETLATAGRKVAVYDAMPSVGRKFLLAGRGGLNLTHSEPLPAFTARYGGQAERFAALLADFGPEQLRQWAAGLGIETFVGTSGRVFPTEFKAAPLLRAWVRRLREQGVVFHPRHRWTGIAPDGALRFCGPDGELSVLPAAAVLALGGGSWAKLGSDGAWVPLLRELGCRVEPLQPANCGFLAKWSSAMQAQAGVPLKNIAVAFQGRRSKGELVISADGLEGGALYALAAPLRDAIAVAGRAVPTIDLKPDLSVEALIDRLSAPRGRLSLSNWLRRAVHLPPAAITLLREGAESLAVAGPAMLARRIKAAPVVLTAPRPLDEAISTAGGLSFEALDERLMLRCRPGLFAAGEMLDWEAPTGGYLLTGCFATGRRAGQGVLEWLARHEETDPSPSPAQPL